MTMPECWRPLSGQGLNLIYAPQGSPVLEYINELRQADVKTNRPDLKAFSKQPGAADSRREISPPADREPVSEQVSVRQVSAVTVASRAVADTRSEPLQSGWAGGLKQPWAQYAAKAKPGRPLLWTYPEAGLDLAGESSKTRSNLIRKIIGALNLPAGSNNFWPHRSRPDTSTSDEREYFFQGLKWLSPSFVLLFGPEALADACPGAEYVKYTFISVQGRLHLILPTLHSLEAEQEFAACLNFLSPFIKSLWRGG